MSLQHQQLKERINDVYKRWKRMLMLKGAAKALITTISALVVVVIIDTVVQPGPSTLLVLLAAVAVLSLATLYLSLIRPLLHAPSQNQLARYIEEKNPELEDRLVSAVELGGRHSATVSDQILKKLLDDTRFHVEPLNLPKFVPAQGATIWGSVALVVSLLLGVFIMANLDFFTLRSNRIFTPWNIPTLTRLPNLHVTPGNARIPMASALEIKAKIHGFEAERATLYFTTSDSAWTNVEMDQESADGFVYNFFNVDQPTKYYVKAEDELSDIYEVTVYDAPRIKRVDLTYTFPKYTKLKTKKEIDGGDIWAPEGTTVRITAIVDKPLREARIMLGGSKKLTTTLTADTVLTASLKVTHDTFYKIHITDTDDLPNFSPPEYYIHALPDQPPALTIEKPASDIKASMLEEVPVRITVEDDYDVSSLKLVYTLNEKPQQIIELPLRRVAKVEHKVELNEIQEFKSGHLFYLEDMEVQPGDFLTYFVEARDNHEGRNKQPVRSEIFFIEVRPFEQDFFRALSQGGQGGGGGGLGRVSQTQKDIFVATWKTEQKRDNLSEDELEEAADAILESQTNLKIMTEQALFQMQQRSSLSGKSNSADITKHYTKALDAMERAIDHLGSHELAGALSPEKESLAALLAAEANFTERQMQQSQGGGGGYTAGLEELAQLFEDEMDDLKNKYETNEQSQQRQNDKAIDEALDKVKELGKRQQQLNQRLRELARKDMPAEEKKRRIQELRRQQEKMRREVNQLARNMQQQNSSMPRDVRDNLKRATSDMNNASNNMRQQNAELAAAKGQQALNRLKRLEDLLQRNQRESLRRQFDSMQEQLRQMAESQKQLTQDVESLAQSGAGQSQDKPEEFKNKKQKAEGKQETLRQEFGEMQKDVKSLAQKARRARNEASRELGQFSKEMEKADLEQKMAGAQKLLKEDRLNSALQAERDIEKMLDKMSAQLAKLRGAFAETEEEKLDLALDQTRQLRENMESLQRQMQNGSGQDGKQDGKTAGEQQLAGDPNAQPRQPGPGENRRPNQKLDPTQLDWMNNELAQARKDLELIQRSAQVDKSLSQQARRLSNNLENLMRTFRGGDENRLKQIEAQVLIPLKSFEAELAQKLDFIKNKEKLFLARDEEIPPQYQELVQKYYEALSKTQK